jgi:hypothetical protein
MNTQKLFAYELVACVGITSWGAIKQGYAPWPPNIIYSTIAIGIISALAAVNERLAVTLGVGFLLALIVKQTTGKGIPEAFAALPPPGYDALSLGTAQPGSGNSGNVSAK